MIWLWVGGLGFRPGTEAALRRLAGERRCRLFPRGEGRGVLACLPIR